jgi:hypothetical protein
VALFPLSIPIGYLVERLTPEEGRRVDAMLRSDDQT